MSKSLLIRGGHVIDPASGIDAVADVLLRDGKVAGLGKITEKPDEILDATGMVVAPGLIDLHVHLREPGQAYKESIATGTQAAAAGGFTSICPMPNTAPVNDSAEITRWMQSSDRGAVVNVFPIAAATVGSQGSELSDFKALHAAGAIAVSDDGKPILDDRIMEDALRLAAKVGMPVIQHAEDTRLTSGATMNAGPVSFRLGLRGMPVEAEAGVVGRDIELARKVKAHVHVAHISTSAALERVKQARAAGVEVTCEVTPHHFVLIDEDIGDYDTRLKMNPPLRSAADRDAMIAGLMDGSIDCIATDHAPHARHEKEVEFDKASFGITGLETALGIALTELHRKRKLPLKRVIELLSTNPAKIANLQGRGTLAVGSVADITIFDPKKRWKFDGEKSKSKARNTPFDGWQFTGRVMATIVGGAVVYRS
jgi:dihydroorotase